MNPALQSIPPWYSAEAIRNRIHELADRIAADFGAGEFAVVSILKGSFIFTADLIRALAARNCHPVIDFMALSSYAGGTVSSRQVTTLQEPSLPLTSMRILLIDDILDTGRTILAARRLLLERNAIDVRVCVLLDKPSRREVPIEADYTGFMIDNVFVIGYGLDHDNRFRELPYLAVLPPSKP